MRDAFIVAVLEAIDDLDEDAASDRIGESLLSELTDKLLKTRPTKVLHDKEDVVRCLECLIELKDVLVVHLLQQFDLSFNRFPTGGLPDPVLLVYLNRHGLLGLVVVPSSHRGIGTLPDLPPDIVLFLYFEVVSIEWWEGRPKLAAKLVFIKPWVLRILDLLHRRRWRLRLRLRRLWTFHCCLFSRFLFGLAQEIGEGWLRKTLR